MEHAKGTIKFFLVLFILASIYQLSFTFVSNRVEAEAEYYASERVMENLPNYYAEFEKVKHHYLDSILTEVVYDIGIASFTYKEVREKELNRGLDLKGGINVILQISVRSILEELSNNSTDPIFNKSLDLAQNRMSSSDLSYLELFFESFNELGNGKTRLSSSAIFGNKNLSGLIDHKTSEYKVKQVIREKVGQSIDAAFEILRKRIDKFGVAQPNLQRLGESGKILVELPGTKDIERVKKLLQSSAKLEFWETYKAEEFMVFLDKTNQYLIKKDKKQIK